MTLTYILIFAAVSLPFMGLVPARWRPWGLLVGSILAIGWLHQSDAFDGLDVTLPAATVLLTVLVWWIVQPPVAEAQSQRDTQLALVLMGGVLGVMWIAFSLSAQDFGVTVMLSGVALTGAGAMSLPRLLPSKSTPETAGVYQTIALFGIAGIILILVALKLPATARFLGQVLGQASDVSAVSLLAWLGFSYVSFRLMSILLDYRAGRLPKEGFALRDMATYVLFFPAYTAGPIDRAQHFIPELEKTQPLDAGRLVDGGMRIAIGIFKKFIVADSLARVAMTPTLIDRTDHVAGLWLILYLYAFQIFFDFSGYSDVAIGLGKLYGINLPENFDRPYLQSNLQQFWQRWHITLSMWFRIYFFTPFSRLLMQSRIKLPQYAIIFAAQVSTMVLIGLWHGITANFVLWGVWHGVGLFVLKYMVDHSKGWMRWVNQRVWVKRLVTFSGILATFHYVALGWVFFALPEPADSFHMLARLFGGT